MDTVSVLSIYTIIRNYTLGNFLRRIMLKIRTPENDEEVKYEWDDDPRVLSTFEDAIQTYEFTWGIREASERRGIGHLLVVVFLSLLGISFI